MKSLIAHDVLLKYIIYDHELQTFTVINVWLFSVRVRTFCQRGLETKCQEEIISLEMIPWWINPKIGTIQFSNCYPINKLYTPAQEMVTSSPLRPKKWSTHGPQLPGRHMPDNFVRKWPKWSFTTYLPPPWRGAETSVTHFYLEINE